MRSIKREEGAKRIQSGAMLADSLNLGLSAKSIRFRPSFNAKQTTRKKHGRNTV